MKTLRMRLTPRPESGLTEISLYSCPDVINDPKKTLDHIQKIANQNAVAVDYELTTDLVYFAVRGGREWLITNPDSWGKDHMFHLALVRAGVLPNANHPSRIIRSDEHDYIIHVFTTTECTSVDTKNANVMVHTYARAQKAHKGPANQMVCAKCGQKWAQHYRSDTGTTCP